MQLHETDDAGNALKSRLGQFGLLVIEPGLQTTVQDGGRWGFQALGVPTSGALDPDALFLANALVGNAAGDAALEIRFSGPRLRARGGPMLVALAGSSAQLFVHDRERATHHPSGHAVEISHGTEFGVSALAGSGVATLAFSGGIEVPAIFGSRATHLRSGMGGHEGRALRAGDLLSVGRRGAGARPMMLPSAMRPESNPRLRVVLGPQDDWFTDDAINALLENPFTLTQEADRMGMRLAGPELRHRKGYDLPSDGIVTGAIQVPGSRQAIILLADHQTTGGYPKIATVISADLAKLGRLLPGARIEFEAVSVQEAEALARSHRASLARLVDAMTPAVSHAMISEAALNRANLISGVVDADQKDADDDK